MYKKGDYVVYKKDVCSICDVYDKNDLCYYKLVPLSDNSLTIDVLSSNNSIRNLVSKREVNDLIDEIVSIKVLTTTNNLLDSNYKELLRDGSMKSLMTIIKTAYLRNMAREKNNKKKSDRDNYYLDLAEKYLYTEISLVLGKSLQDTKNIIIDKMMESVNS